MIHGVEMDRYHLLIFLVIFASGCAGFSDIFGGDVLNIQQTVVQEEPRDVLIVKDAQLIPFWYPGRDEVNLFVKLTNTMNQRSFVRGGVIGFIITGQVN